ncbi:hypothetical protein [Aestuariivirga sp.]|uniref:DUF7507 domain-containing protein n=1 Tax=Aestuariivirga sp. TaxID=2650926 RepID=UPI0039E456F2
MDSRNLPRQFARFGPRPQLRLRLWGSTALAAILAAAQASPAYATINNTATASGTAGSTPVTASDTVAVDVVNAAPATTVTKTWALTTDLNGDGNADIGDVVTYTYVVTNSGNVTIQDVKLTDAHAGAGAALVFTNPTAVTTDFKVPGDIAGTTNDSTNVNFTDNDWDVLGPGDVLTFRSTYTIVSADYTAPGASDGDIDNTASVNATYNSVAVATSTSSAAVPLDLAPRMTVAKTADDTTDRLVGDVVAYTYTIRNTGNVAITNVTLADVQNGFGTLVGPTFGSFTVTNGSTRTGNTINTFNPGSVAVYNATYTVKQRDVDLLQ